MNTSSGAESPASHGAGYQPHYRAASNTSVDRGNHAPPPQNPYPGPALQPQHTLHRIPSSVEAATAYHGSAPGPSRHETRHPHPASTQGAPQAHSPPNHHPVQRFTEHQSSSPLHFQYDNGRAGPLPTPPASGGQPNLSIKTQFSRAIGHNPQKSSPFPLPPQPTPNRRATIPGGSQSYPQQAPPHVNDPASSIRHPGDHPAAASPHTTHPPRRNESQLPPNSAHPGLPPVDPIVHTAAEVALQPIRNALENIWTLSLHQARQAMNKMHQDYVHAVSQERQKNAQLSATIDQLSSNLRTANESINSLQQDRQSIEDKRRQAMGIIESFKKEYGKLRTEHEQLKVKCEVLSNMHVETRGGGEGRSSLQGVDISSVVGAVTEQVTKKVDGRISEIMSELQEQKALRVQAEQKIANTFGNLTDTAHGQPRRTPSTTFEHGFSPRLDGPSAESSPAIHHSTHFRRPSSPMMEDAAFNKRLSISSHSSSSTRVDKPSMSPFSAQHRLPAQEPSGLRSHADRVVAESVYRSPQSVRTSPLLASPRQIHAEPLRRRSLPPQPATQSDFTPRTPPPIFPSPPRKRSRADYEADDRHSSPTSERAPTRARAEGTPPFQGPVAESSSLRGSPPVNHRSPTLGHRQEVDTQRVVIKQEPNDEIDHEDGEINDEIPGASRPELPAPAMKSRLPTPPQSVPLFSSRPLPVTTSAQPDSLATHPQAPRTVSRPRISSVPRPTAVRSNTMEKQAETTSSTGGETTRSNNDYYQPRPQQESRVDNNQQARPQPPTPQAPPPPPRTKQLGISHIDLLYKTENGSMVCRMCITRRKDAIMKNEEHTALPLIKFPVSASWPELITHCQTEHPNACADLEKCGPSQIAEMKQRMMASDGHVRRK